MRVSIAILLLLSVTMPAMAQDRLPPIPAEKQTPEQRKAADDINRWLVEKKLDVPIGRTFPLSETAAAHRLLEENTLGKAGTLWGKVVVLP